MTREDLSISTSEYYCWTRICLGVLRMLVLGPNILDQ